MKKFLFTVMSLLLLALTLEIISGYCLFVYQIKNKEKNIWAPDQSYLQAYESGNTAFHSLLKTSIKIFSKNKIKSSNSDEEIKGDPISLFQTIDPVLGWVPKTGAWRIILKNKNNSESQTFPQYHDWECKFFANGERNTGWTKTIKEDTKTVWILGESWMQGWALDDSLTFAHQLQAILSPKYRVRCFANGSWGSLHALRLANLYTKEIKKNDILIIDFADWILPRNLPSPSVVNSILENRKINPQLYDILLPLYSENKSERLVKTMTLDSTAFLYAKKKDPSYEELIEISKKIFLDIKTKVSCEIFILIVDQTGPLIETFLKENFKIIDARPSMKVWQKDNVLPYNAHPGPIQNAYWARLVSKTILQNE
jgi:hypothetical protein